MRAHFELALRNVNAFGDTDVLPLPIENHVFFDELSATVDLLMQLHKDFAALLAKYPPSIDGLLASVGYTGFRWVTRIDPLWNLYFLGLVISLGPQIEAARLPIGDRIVYSYRFGPDYGAHKLFREDVGWIQFRERALELAAQHTHVLSCDISDFYPRIYHHRLDNALQLACPGVESVHRVMRLLTAFSKNVSYGLPVGGPAARLLSELLLNRVDRLLVSAGIVSCRFADDYRIFASSEQEIYSALLFLSDKLFHNEGLLLQRSKTRISTAGEYIASERAELEPNGTTTDAAAFLRLRIRYDPYSQTAAEDYEHLRDQLKQFDILGMLTVEIRKTHVHQGLVRRLITAIRFLQPEDRVGAVETLIQNLPILYPVFPSVARVLHSLTEELPDTLQQMTVAVLTHLAQERSYIVTIPNNLAYTIRILGTSSRQDVEPLLAKLYRDSESALIRSEVILAMGRRKAHYWLSDKTRSFATMSPWERRALLVASYTLAGDEGGVWRDRVQDTLTPLENLVKNWAASRKNKAGPSWVVPL